MEKEFRFPFGKYMGEKPENIKDIKYLIWWDKCIEEHPLPDEIIEKIEEYNENKELRTYNTTNGWADCSALEILTYGC